MVAAGIANKGVLMTPHLMSSIHDSQGALVQTYTPKAESTVATAQTAQQVTSLMEGVVTDRHGGRRWVPVVPVRGGQDGNRADRPDHRVTDTWMIGFAPANNPQVAVAVVVPQQANSSDGAGVAGPIMKAVLQAALPQWSVSAALHRAARPDVELHLGPLSHHVPGSRRRRGASKVSA